MPTINEMLAAHLTIQTRVKHNENRKITCESKLESLCRPKYPQSHVGHPRILHEREKNQNLHTPKVNLPGG